MLRNSTTEAAMATVNFSVPDEVKERFNRAFEGRNKSQVIAELMIRAIEEEAMRRQRVAAIDALVAGRSKRRPASAAAIVAARRAGRP
jgi:metal-responsive CopG/Arc/MetJ family transcriptional regulator